MCPAFRSRLSLNPPLQRLNIVRPHRSTKQLELKSRDNNLLKGPRKRQRASPLNIIARREQKRRFCCSFLPSARRTEELEIRRSLRG